MVSIQAQTEILSNGMSSPSAIEFLNSLPPIDTLMLPLDFKLIEKLTGKTYESDADDERKVVQLRLVHGDKDDKRDKPDDPHDVAKAQPDPNAVDHNGFIESDYGIDPTDVATAPVITEAEDMARTHDKHELDDDDAGLTP